MLDYRFRPANECAIVETLTPYWEQKEKLMAHWFENNSLLIGCASLVRLNRVVDGAQALVLGKIEGRNPAYSVKYRIGMAERYLSSILFEGLFDAQGLATA